MLLWRCIIYYIIQVLLWRCTVDYIIQVAMLLRRALADEVYLQNENPEGIKVMVKFVQGNQTK